MALARVAHLPRAPVEEGAQDPAGVVGRAADDEAVGRLAPALPQPGDVGLEPARGGDDRSGPDPVCRAPVGDHRGGEGAVLDLEVLDRRLVGDAHAELLGGAVVGVEQRLPAAEEEGVGSVEVEGPAERRLEAHAAASHPVAEALVQYGINALLLATLAQGWNVIGGFTGYPSFGNSVFFGLGTYGTAIAMARYQLPFGAGLVAGAALAVACAVLLGLPILRLRGPYFAIATLGLSAVMSAIFANLDVAGRNIGLILPLLRGDLLFYELSLGLLVLATATVAWVARSRFGAGLVAIRESEDAAQVMGVDTTRWKVSALALSAVFSALAGGIHAYWITFIDPASAFDPTLNVKMVIMAVFGGPGTVLGPVVGALALSAVSEVLASRLSTVAGAFYGLVVVLAVIAMPKGLMDLGPGLRRLGWRYFAENVRRHRL